MYSLLSTDIERFFQRYTSNIHHHNKIMMYISGIFIDLNVGRIRKMNSFNSIFFKIKNNKVFLRSKKCKILYNNIFNFTEGEQAFKDLMNMIFSTTFPVFELAQFNIKINFHNQKVLEIETDKPYKIFVFRNRKSVEKRFVNI
ncbi:MAG: hypothetical protein NZZ41_07575, partial [Candidatus Dojkabacteria bacterium]|nr:hypothetical protein [Candidatus Dojkabacteria bacterium]